MSLAILLYLFFGSYRPRTATTGVLVPEGGAIRILAPTGGIVSERHVREGQIVKQGAVLFVLADERRHVGQQVNTKISELRTASLGERRASLMRQREAAHELGVTAERGLRVQSENVMDELRHNKQELDLHAKRLAASEISIEKHRTLAKSNYISQVALREKEDQAAALQAQFLSMQRTRSQLSRTLATLKSELAQVSLKTAAQIAEINRDLAILSQETTDVQSRDVFAITAPMTGMVTAINAEPGETVSTKALAVIIPESVPLVAHLFATSKAFGFVQVGQSVRLRYQPYPYQIFGLKSGTVVEVSNSPLQPEEVAMIPAPPNKEAMYRVVVRLDSQTIQARGRQIALLPGTLLEADIEQEEHRLLDWVLSPIMAASRHL
ncbi:secretion protein HlyD family protein [Cupriavidus basilensis OR16]|uniref:Secretion protein HlyD family protein n=1 Tax=Cupriavidus basilensis OR16 TaxID=1127483 RepID=H1SDT5_9BURK|nr:HlyD family efflux transporter periplasmic adaptor subunit [Cupriavidus basilensis]EHP39362.1 secretion protein HlyD family protein [Cupriavidus basilensis OR16]